MGQTHFWLYFLPKTHNNFYKSGGMAEVDLSFLIFD